METVYKVKTFVGADIVAQVVRGWRLHLQDPRAVLRSSSAVAVALTCEASPVWALARKLESWLKTNGTKAMPIMARATRSSTMLIPSGLRIPPPLYGHAPFTTCYGLVD